MRNLTVVMCSVLFAGLAWAQPSPVAEKKPATPEALKAEIETLQAAKVAWREIPWKELPARRAQGVAPEEEACVALDLHRPPGRRRPLLSVRRRRPGGGFLQARSHSQGQRRFHPRCPEGRVGQQSANNEEAGSTARSAVKPAPQGICVVNSAGKVLDWR